MDRGELYSALAKAQLAYDHQYYHRVSLESTSVSDDVKKRAKEVLDLLRDVKCILEQDAFLRIKSDKREEE